MLVYPDTCILIYLVEENPVLHPRIEATIRSAPCAFGLSELLRLECRVGPMRAGDTSLLARFDRVFAATDHRFLEASRRAFELATELRAHDGLITPDALHLAISITGGCDQFWTNDRRLEKAADGRIAIVAFN